ncbi:hypothetical protein DPEC_G00148980 [Dallia pectoralis]|uniref:Uncharacterized protein n=1 Tax=Dallia pectoralis TaxID=75939 RepID=A0ACC2GIW0_DALPE|nr:hypothetical protein DPEC_G00148980 [Dallia pectoralis]
MWGLVTALKDVCYPLQQRHLVTANIRHRQCTYMPFIADALCAAEPSLSFHTSGQPHDADTSSGFTGAGSARRRHGEFACHVLIGEEIVERAC